MYLVPLPWGTKCVMNLSLKLGGTVQMQEFQLSASLQGLCGCASMAPNQTSELKWCPDF